jgi:hypothetical protein
MGQKLESHACFYGPRCVAFSLSQTRNASRLQNMILAVGPGTPAAVLMKAESLGSARTSSSVESSSSSSSASSAHADENDDDDDAAAEESGRSNIAAASAASSGDTPRSNRRLVDSDDEEQGNSEGHTTRRGRFEVGGRRRPTGLSESEQEDDNDSNRDDTEMSQRMVESALMGWYSANEDDDDEEDDDERHSPQNYEQHTPVSSMRHGGCINTAAWLDCGWRLSSPEPSSISSSCESVISQEDPTQLITSGDDYVVKFWDVRNAMGMTSPLLGGYCTLVPFSSSSFSDDSSLEQTRIKWERHYSTFVSSSTRSNDLRYSGSIIPLATLQTGHRGNVFHLTPLRGRPGKVLTCGADGFLRMSDLEASAGVRDGCSSRVIVSPEYDDDVGGLLPAGLFSMRPGMCFSHHFLNEQNGLLCSERGLKRFDLRLPPQEQPKQSIMGGPFRACKACAVWSTASESSLEEGDSAYVFGKSYYSRILNTIVSSGDIWGKPGFAILV